MPSSTSTPDLPAGLVEQLLEGPILRADRIEAGRLRAASPPGPDELAAAVVAEGPPLLQLARDEAC